MPDDRQESEYERGTGSALSDLKDKQRIEAEDARDKWLRGDEAQRWRFEE